MSELDLYVCWPNSLLVIALSLNSVNIQEVAL
jgi:hypothetical protein